jgi:hypothetical protein
MDEGSFGNVIIRRKKYHLAKWELSPQRSRWSRRKRSFDEDGT